MKKKGIELKGTIVKVYAAMFAAVLVLGVSACGTKGEEGGGGTSSTPIESIGAETQISNLEETGEPSASEGLGDNERVENNGVGEPSADVEGTTEDEEPVVEEVYFDTETFQTLIDDLTAKYSNMEKKEVQAAILMANYDHITKEDWGALLETYSFSEEELNNQVNAFVESYQAGIWKTARYYMDMQNSDKEAYSKLIKFEEFALTDTDKEVAIICDEIFKADASAQYGQQYVDDYIDNNTSFEMVCNRMQYFMSHSKHSEEYDDISNVFTK